MTYILWATKIGDPDWAEQLITEGTRTKIEKARPWAISQGFDRLRVSTFNGEPPDFVGALNL